MSRILVTGATGFVGTHLTKKLVESGHDVVVLARRPDEMTSLEGLPVKFFVGDILNLESVLSASQSCDSIFHLAGLIAYKKAERSAMHQVNVVGTENVIKVCQQLHTKNLVFMSSVVAVGAGRTPEEVLNENSTYNLTHLNLGYFETKRAAEKRVMELHTQGETRCIIVNPSTIYGPADAKKGSRKTQVKVAQGKFPFYTRGGVSIVDIEDAIQGIILAWEKGRSGERYILSGQNITIQELFRLIAEAAGVSAPGILMPNSILHILGAFGDFRNSLGFSTSLSRENAWTATMYHWFDNAKAQKELGFQARPAKDSIQKSVQWMKENGWLD